MSLDSQAEKAFKLAADRALPFVPRDTYSYLMGTAPDTVQIESDHEFDRHVFACILSVAAAECGALTEQVGLSAEELQGLEAEYFDGRRLNSGSSPGSPSFADLDDLQLLRGLLLAHLRTTHPHGHLLAAMVARRALEPNHLWEDLGLRNRLELTRLIERCFPTLAAGNNKNMRWKRFFYRQMCENDGFVMCSTPVCTNCADYQSCFGVEDGISRLSSETPFVASVTNASL